MKNKFIFLLVLFIGIIFLNSKIAFANKNLDLFKEIVDKNKGLIVEKSIKVTFNSDDKEDFTLIVSTLKEMGFKNKFDFNPNITTNTYTITINKENIDGYIQRTITNGTSLITLNIQGKGNDNEIDKTKNKIQDTLSEQNINAHYYEYLKAKVTESNLLIINENIINILKKNKATNIDTVELSNGFSTIAYTKQYETIKNNGKLIDFNFAVSKYSSGTYITIGTPIITTTY